MATVATVRLWRRCDGGDGSEVGEDGNGGDGGDGDDSGTVAEHSATNSKIERSNPAAPRHRKTKMMTNKQN